MFPTLQLSYNPLPSYPPESDSSEDPRDGYESAERKGPDRKPLSCISIKAAIGTFLLILQLGLILHFHEAASLCERRELGRIDTFEARFESDQSYQSLDHIYDGLWNETGQSPIVMTSIGLENGQAEVGSITM